MRRQSSGRATPPAASGWHAKRLAVAPDIDHLHGCPAAVQPNRCFVITAACCQLTTVNSPALLLTPQTGCWSQHTGLSCSCTLQVSIIGANHRPSVNPTPGCNADSGFWTAACITPLPLITLPILTINVCRHCWEFHLHVVDSIPYGCHDRVCCVLNQLQIRLWPVSHPACCLLLLGCLWFSTACCCVPLPAADRSAGEGPHRFCSSDGPKACGGLKASPSIKLQGGLHLGRGWKRVRNARCGRRCCRCGCSND